MTNNLLDIPFKRTRFVDIVSCLTELISTQYIQPIEEFIPDINRLGELRKSVVNASVSRPSLSSLTEYNIQLCYLSTKLPVDIGSAFEWYDPANKLSHATLDDLTFERANVLYDLAAICAGLGLQENRATADGLKKAHQQFQTAAGCFSVLEKYFETVIFQPPEDMQPTYLSCLRTIMLAQAQECIWQRAVVDQMKDKLIAQLSEQVSKYYQEALELLESSTAMSISWVHHLSLKHYHFAAAAQVRMSSFALSSNRYGEEVARLRWAKEYCDKAQPHAPYVNKSVAQDLKGLTDHVRTTSTKAEKDNDLIYMLPVPAKNSLVPIAAQIMVKAVVPPEIGSPLASVSKDALLFRSLIPLVIRNVIEIFEQRKQATITNDIENKLRALDLDLQALLQKLGLPGSLTALEQPIGLPQSLVHQAEEVRYRGGSTYLEGLLDEVATLAAANNELVDQIVDTMDEATLDSEESEDDSMAAYRNQINEYTTFLQQAKTSDELVKSKVSQWKRPIDLLATDEQSLAKSIPSGGRASMTKERESTARRVRICLNKCEQLHLERETQLEKFRHYADSDDVTTDLVQHLETLDGVATGAVIPASEFEPILSRRLSRYEEFIDFVQRSGTAQASLVKDLEAAHGAFQDNGHQSRESTDREVVLQELNTAHQKYREIIHNLEEGAKFYTDFHKALCRVSDEIKAVTALLVKTKNLTIESPSSTVVGYRSPTSSGTWRPEAGIAFKQTSSPIQSASSSTRESGVDTRHSSRMSHAFDPTKHGIQFKQSNK